LGFSAGTALALSLALEGLMILTTLLLMLKLTTVYVAAEDPLKKDDQTLATCVAKALVERPSPLTLAPTDETVDATLVIGNHAGVRIHVRGRLVRPDGSVLIDVDHVQHGLNHSLCNQANGLLDEMAKKLAQQQPRVK
jgi:hypothetical protein